MDNFVSSKFEGFSGMGKTFKQAKNSMLMSVTETGLRLALLQRTPMLLA